ncbi:MAG TPA: histidine kinase [Clostridiales bacterium]|nr:histidine kinase [Clostridiales bacterium]
MIKKLLNIYNNKSIFFRISFIIIPLFIAMLIIPIMNFMFFTKEKKNDIYSAVNQTNHQAMSKIDDYLIDIANITKIPLTYKQNDKSYLRYLSDFNKTGDITRDFQVMNEQMFEEIFAYKSNIEACYVYNLNGIGDYKVRTPVYNILSPLDLPMFQDSIDMFGKPIILDTYQLPYVSHEKDPVYVFGISRGIVSFVESKVIGIIVVVTRTEYFQELSEDMKKSDNHRIIILDNDYVIYDTQEENIASTASKDLMEISWDSPQDEKTISIEGQEYMSSSVLSDYSGWRIISLIPEEEIFHDLEKMQLVTLLIIILLIVISLLLGFIFSFQIVHPLKKLGSLMKLAENGDFDIKVKVNSKDEIGTLAQAFNSMISKINSLIHEVYIEQIRQSELELQMLQSQINPHFIYNTLESISMMATIHNDDSTSEMAYNLGSILRYGINKTKEVVTVREELDNLEKYISLQEIRFHSVYTITISVSPDLYDIYITKLILQPIVENAIFHGMKDIRSGGKIIVTGYKTDNNLLVFEVEDNGKGMTDSLTKDLNDYINDKNNLFSSIGLRNVNKRIKIKYGDEYGLEIQSIADIGTKVIVRLPIENT